MDNIPINIINIIIQKINNGQIPINNNRDVSSGSVITINNSGYYSYNYY